MKRKSGFVSMFGAVAGIAMLLAACKDGGSSNHAPIIMGNPNTIVTDTDQNDLHDMVATMEPLPDTAANTDSPAAKSATAAAPKTATTIPAPATATGGLNVIFSEVTIAIPGIAATPARKQNLLKANGATYTLTGGVLAGNRLIAAGEVSRVSQRSHTIIVIRNEMGVLPLEPLSAASSWQPLRANGNSYALAGLEPGKLPFDNASPAALRNAISRECRKMRLARGAARDWLKAAQRIRNVSQQPCQVVLRTVEWKIEGKDGKGKKYQKQLRIDMPLPK